MSAPIRCDGLAKRFRRINAIQDLELEVPEGSMYALVGPNGAGKTTLMKMLVNILRPTGGRATVLGTDSRRLSAGDFARIGYVSENQDLPEWMSADYLFAYLKPFYPGWDDSLAEELIREFEFPRDRPIRQFSRGTKMKLALASSLAYHPRLILLDEPFSGLDPLMRDEFIQGLLERAADTTVLVSSHDLAEIESFATHIGFLDAGCLQFSEDAGVLTGRFREIEITLQAKPLLPPNLPASWLKPQTSAAVVRFVDSLFDSEKTVHEIYRFFPDATDIAIHPMSLREIFVALAGAHRKAVA